MGRVLGFKDIYPKHDKKLEWWYLWGKLEDDRFFHYVLFKIKVGREAFYTVHSSLHSPDPVYFDERDDELEGMKSNLKFTGEEFIGENEQMSFVAKPFQYMINHEFPERDYFSIPSLSVQFDNSTGDAWFDHESRERVWGMLRGGDWDWICIKLYSGISLMLYYGKGNQLYSILIYKGEKYRVKIDHTGNCISLPAYDLKFFMEPLAEEKVFKPQIGLKYSEQPFWIYDDNGKIGYGMRERTYTLRSN